MYRRLGKSSTDLWRHLLSLPFRMAFRYWAEFNYSAAIGDERRTLWNKAFHRSLLSLQRQLPTSQTVCVIIYKIFANVMVSFENIKWSYYYRSTIQFDVDLIQRHGSAEKSAVWIPPAVTVSRPLLLALGRVDMEVCLEKTSVVDGEPLIINISITNQSNKNIRGMKVMMCF